MPRILFAVLFAFLSGLAPASADGAPAAVASIKPVHSLVAAVMGGAGEPALLLEGHQSPHTYAMKPSAAAALQNADIVFRIGPDLETFLNGPLESLGGAAKIVDLANIGGLETFGFRPPGVFAEIGEQGSGHSHDGEREGDGHDHEHVSASFDMHLWLDPGNAAKMVRHIADVLIETDPARVDLYQQNAIAVLAGLDRLALEIDEQLAPVRGKRFIVFHDAYQYFEHRFELEPAGSVSLNPQTPPGAETVAELAGLIAGNNIACAFVEPQFSPKLVKSLAGGSGVRIGTLDPLGSGLPAGPDQYGQTLRAMARSFRDCLAD